MKKLLLLHLLLMLSLALSAQNWHTDFATAKSIAEKENKPIVLVFSGSDWCAPCMKLEKEIWSSETFKTYAKENYILLKADFCTCYYWVSKSSWIKPAKKSGTKSGGIKCETPSSIIPKSVVNHNFKCIVWIKPELAISKASFQSS